MGDVYKTKVITEIDFHYEVRIVYCNRETGQKDDDWYEIQRKVEGHWEIVHFTDHSDFFTTLEKAEEYLETLLTDYCIGIQKYGE